MAAPISADEIRRLADLESREVLLAKLAGAMNGSLTKAVSLFAAPLSQAARVIDALRAQREASGESVPLACPAPRLPRADADQTPLTPLPRLTPNNPPNLLTKGRHIMAKISSGDLLDAFKEMTLLELSEFVKTFEDTFGVTAAALRSP